jgi:hypothetical protein
VGGGDTGFVQVDVIAKAEDCTKYDHHKGIEAAICLRYHVQGAAIMVPWQAIAKLVQQRALDLHIRDV